MTIVPADFAIKCVEDGLFFGVQPHYMLGVARLRSHIVDDTDGNMIGPFRLTSDQWAANSQDDTFQIDCLPTDITLWDMQCDVFGLMSTRAQDKLTAALNRNPSPVELYLEQWPNTDKATLPGLLSDALNATAPLLGPASEAVLNTSPPSDMVIRDPTAHPTGPGTVDPASLDFSTIAKARRPMATLIVQKFGAAGYGKVQQVAALANAIAESNLNPDAHAGIGEDSWGLFQLNRRGGGLGTGKDPAELRDPDINIGIILDVVRKIANFKSATSIGQAESIFVRQVEKPGDVPGQITRRVKIANALV